MTNLEYFIKRYRNKKLLIDTNLLILLLVGSTDKNFIQKVKATRSYSDEDYSILKNIVKNFTLITTSHVLTEASNLCEKADKFFKNKVFNSFSTIIEQIIEVPFMSKEAINTPVFHKLGLTDSVIFSFANSGIIVLTDDFELHSYLINYGAVAANMNLFRGEHLFKRS